MYNAKSIIWNPWHGCRKYSEGCRNCYVYRRDTSVGRDASVVERNADFDLPVRRDRAGNWKIPDGSHVFCCMTSDFFLDAADGWRPDVWRIMRERSGISFTIITKRIVRFSECAPPDWGDTGYPNVALCCTVENQKEADRRLPVFARVPAAEKSIACEPLLGPIEIGKYLVAGDISELVAGGESGAEARVCDYEWILSLRRQCAENGVSFWFKQTGALFRRDGRVYFVKRRLQHRQAAKAGINLIFPGLRHAKGTPGESCSQLRFDFD